MGFLPWSIPDDGSTSGESDMDEDIDSWSDQNCAELLDLGVDLDDEIMWLAREAHLAHLPQGWSQHTDSAGRIFFYNQLSNQSTWTHPGREKIDELTQLIKGIKAETPGASEEYCKAIIEEHLLRVQLRASEEINKWSGPYLHDGEPYYYNSVLDLSTWLSPVEVWEEELNSRAQLLARALLPGQFKHAETVAHGSRTTPDIARGTRTTSEVAGGNVVAHFRRSPPPPIEIVSPALSRAASPSSAPFHSARSLWSSHSARSATPSQRRRLHSFSPLQRSPPHSDGLQVTPKLRMSESVISPMMHKTPKALKKASQEAPDVEGLIETFANDLSQKSLKLPQTLSAQERKTAKAMVEKHVGLKCESFGFGAERQLHVFKTDNVTQRIAQPTKSKLGTTSESAALREFTFGRGESLCMESAKESGLPLDDFTFGHADPLSVV